MPLNDAELEFLLGRSRRRNEAEGLTGLLLHLTSQDEDSAAFVQVVEGDRAAVERPSDASSRTTCTPASPFW